MASVARTIAIRKSRKPWARKPWFFVWVAENGERTGQSQMYASYQAAEDEANRAAAAKYTVVDET